MTDRPNILCLVSEDCPPWLGAYGDPLARTPHIDALAAQGVRWQAACATAPVCAPSRFAILTGRHAPSVPPAQHMTAEAELPPGVITYPEMMRGAGYYCTNNAKTHYNCTVDPAAIWDESSPSAHWRNRPPGAPFLAVFNCMDTHESCIFHDQPGPVKPAEVALPAHLPDTPELRVDMARYYNRIARMDGFIGAHLAELDASGLSEDTIVLYHSDHAAPLPRSKRFCYDDGLRVPLVLLVPDRWRHLLPLDPGTRLDDPVSLVDLMPTFAALAGIDPPPGLHGQPFAGAGRQPRDWAFSARDRMDEHHDMIRTARSARYRYIRNYAPHRIWGQHYAFAWVAQGYQSYERLHLAGALTGAPARFWQAKQAEELYDMQADPHAVRNLAEDAGHAVLLLEARAALDRHLAETQDCGFVPEGTADEATAARDPDRLPLARLRDLAGAAIRRDPAELPRFLDALDDPCDAARYWGAQGLLMLACAGHAPPEGLAGRVESETAPAVRIALSEAMGHWGADRPAVAWLTAFLAEAGNPRLRVQALDALIALPLYPDLTLATATAAADDDDEYVRGAGEYLRQRLTGDYRPENAIFRFDRYAGGKAAGAVHTPPAALRSTSP